MSGTTPAGARNEQEASRWVRGMFGRVAPRYDLANHLLSFNIDRYWRAHTVQPHCVTSCERPDARVLDICCGTGDLVLALAETAAPCWAAISAIPMLVAAHEKVAEAARARGVLRVGRAESARCAMRRSTC